MSAVISGQQRKKRAVSPKSIANLKPFVKGKSGNPAGVKKGFQSLSAAYKRLMCLSPEDFEAYKPTDWTERVAKEMLQQAADDADSRIQAVKEIADRTEGKPESNKNIKQDVTVRVIFDDDPRTISQTAPAALGPASDSESEPTL
jgi:hypothetical protein